MNIWQQVLIAILTSGAITSIFQLILKSAVEHKFNQELLRMTKDLELKAQERNIKLTKTFDKQAKVVVTVYQKLVQLNTVNYRMIICQGSKPKITPEQMEEISELQRDFYEYFFNNKIYLPKPTAKKIAEFEQAQSYQRHRFSTLSDTPNNIARADEQMDIYDKMHNEIPELLSQLESDFQTILGFPITEQTKTS